MTETKTELTVSKHKIVPCILLLEICFFVCVPQTSQSLIVVLVSRSFGIARVCFVFGCLSFLASFFHLRGSQLVLLQDLHWTSSTNTDYCTNFNKKSLILDFFKMNMK